MNWDFIILLIFIIILISIIIWIKNFLSERKNRQIDERINFIREQKQKEQEEEKEKKIEMIIKPKNLFSKIELLFYNNLKKLLENENIIILSKVRLLDLIDLEDKHENYLVLFNKISRKHIDFVITDENWEIKCLIELDDRSHQKKRVKINDEFKNDIFEKINVPIIRYKVWEYWNYNMIIKIIKKEPN